MLFKVKEPIEIPEGMHNGTIAAVEYRDKPFSYVDVIFEVTDYKTKDGDAKPKVKIGFPACVTTKSKLGLFLAKFGGRIEAGQDVDPEKILVGKQAAFMTYNEETKDGRYARIVPDSIRYVRGGK